MLPDIDGYTTCEILKSSPDTRDIPVIFLSALDDVASKTKGFAVGGVDYVSKPFHETEVIARINTHISLSRTRNDLKSTIHQLSLTEEKLRQNYNEIVIKDRKLQESEEKSRMIFSMVPEPILLTKISDGTVIDCNRAIEDLIRRSHDEIVGTTTVNLHIWKTIEDRQKFLDDLLQTGRIDNREMVWQRSDGTFLTILLSSRIIEINGEKIIINVGFDYTSQKKAEQLLKDSEEMYRNPVEQSPVGVFLCQDGFFRYANARLAMMFGYLRDEIIKIPAEKLIAAPYRDKISEILMTPDTILSSDSYLEFQGVRSDGTPLDLELYASCMQYQGCQAIYGTIIDITYRKQIEEARYQSERMYRLIAENMRDVICIIDFDTMSFRYMSPSIELLIGYSVEEIMVRTVTEVLTPDISNRIKEIMRNHLKEFMDNPDSPEYFTTRAEIRCKNGSSISTDIVTSFLADNATGSVEVLCVIRDITERTRSEETARRSEKSLNEAQKLARIGSWDLNLITNHLEWSDVIYQIFEIDPSTFKASYEDFLDAIHPDDRERVNLAYTTSVKTKTPYQIEHRLLMSDGRIKYVLEQCETKYDSHGNPLSSLGTVQDITERKIQEISLRETNNYLESLISIANVPIIVWNTSFQITRLNHAFEYLIGRSAEEVIGTSLDFLFPPDQADRSMRLLQSTLDGVRWETTEIDIMHKDESIRTLLWNSATLYSADGGIPIATIAQGHDITRERILEHERDYALSQIEHNLAYLATLNDEIRNPLTIILTFSDMIKDPVTVEQIAVQIQRIDILVSQLDKRWTESEKILEYLRKHHQFSLKNSIKPNHSGIEETRGLLPGTNDIEGIRKKQLLVEEVQAELYTILDSIDALVYVADMETYDLLYMNQRGRNFFGSAIGKKCYHFLNHGKEEPCSFCTNPLLKDQFGSTGVYHREYQNHWNGRWYDCRDRVIRWTDGRLVRLEIASDITRHKVIEKTLAQEMSLLSQAEAVSHMGSWRLLLENGKVSWSDEMFNIFGIRKTIFDQNAETLIETLIYPEDREKFKEMLSTVIQKNLPQQMDYRIMRPDGSIRWIHNFGEPEYDENGRNVAIAGYIQDITEQREKEEALLNYQKRLERIIEGTRAGTWEWNIQTGETIYDERWAEIIGYTLDELAPVSIRTWEDLVHPDDLKYAKDILDKHFSGILPYYECEFRMMHKDGHWVWIYDHGRIILRSDDNRPLMMFGTHIDITERKQAEIQLQESELRYKAISEITTDFEFSCRKERNSSYTINWLTGSFKSITGYTLEELLRMGCWRDLVYQDDLPLFDENVINLPPGSNRACSLRILTKDGTIRWLAVNTTNIPADNSSQYECIYGGCRDITDYKKAEENLRKSEETYRLTLEATNDGFWDWDILSGNTVFSQRFYTMLGYNPGDFPATFDAWSELIHPDDREHTVSELIRQVQEKCEFPQIEYRIRAKNGTWIWILGRGKPVAYDEQGKVTRLIGTNTDITQRNKIEKSFRESEERYRKLVHNVPDYILVHRDGEILFVNETGATAMGYHQDELTGTNLMEYLTPESKDTVFKMLQKRVAGNIVPPYEITILTRDGIPKITEVRGVLIQYEGEIAVLNVLTDITERKRELEALRTSENRFRSIIDSIHVGIIIVDAETQIILEANMKACEMIGAQNDSISGSLCHQFICPVEIGKCPITDLEQTIDSSERVLLTAHGEEKPILKTVIRTILSGKEVLIESLVDISDRKQIEEAFRSSELKYRQLIEHANDAIIIVRQRYIQFLNPRMTELTGFSEKELLSIPYTHFIHPDDRDIVTGMYDRRMQGENPPSRYSFRIMKKDGNMIWVEISVVLIEWENCPATLSFVSDITERKQAEDALRESNKKLRLLTSLTRHDIFNQLSTIDLLQTMALESKDLSTIYNCLNHARMAESRIETIIGFTRQYEDFGVVSSDWEVISQVIESAKNEVVLGMISIENNILPDLEVYADPIIRKVFTTLMENAVRHGEKITTIRFSWHKSAEGLIITCEDDGIGIPVEDKDQIFDHGYGSHTGIGLFLAREILSITGLSIRERGIFGKGAEFEIVVPSGKFRIKNVTENAM